MKSGILYEAIGTSSGTTPDGQEVVGLLFANDTSEVDGEFDELFVTLPGAKALLIDLRDAIAACEEHKAG